MERICMGDGWNFFRNDNNQQNATKLSEEGKDIKRRAGRLADASEERIAAPYAESCEEEGEGGSVGVHRSFT